MARRTKQRELTPQERVREREVADRVERARRADPPLATQWYVQAGELANQLGLDTAGVLDMFAEMVQLHVYAGSPRDVAEPIAWQQTEEILVGIAAQRRGAAA